MRHRVVTRVKRAGRMVAALLGIVLLAYLVHRTGPARLIEGITAAGWGLTLVVGLGGLSHVIKTWAWRFTLLDEKRNVSFARMLALRLGSEAVGQIGIFGQVYGEALRVSRLGPSLSVARKITSVTLDRALFTLSAFIVTTAGMTAVLFVLPLPHKVRVYAEVFLAVLVGIIFLAGVAIRKRWPVLSRAAQGLARVPYFRRWLERERSVIDSVETKLLDFCHHAPGAFWAAFALNVACHGAAILEVYLTLRLLGARVSFVSALAVEALTKLTNVVGMLNPGNIGTYEGGNMIFAKLLGLSAATGLTVGLIRRIRALFWTAIGALWMIMLPKPKTQNESGDIPIDLKTGDVRGDSHVAVILADERHGNASLVEVGSLPALLRIILGAKRAGAKRIVVAADRATRIVSKLRSTRRLPETIEWYQTSGGESLLSIVKNTAGGEDRIVLIAGDRTYHPSLYQLAAEWTGENALALTTGERLVGIYALATQQALKLGKTYQGKVGTIEDLDRLLRSTESVDYELVPEEKWQLLATPEDRLVAEQKLNGWLVKPTDGVFARMNRRVSIPISRQIIKFPITPNMVSLFTLGVSFLSGVFFAFGGYLNMLAGALLSLFASILDGSDGEVARLKLQESEFGCWLETICDYLYYLFIFVGMMIGLMKRPGGQEYLIWGGILFFGAVASFVTTALQRNALTAGRPEQYLRIWQARASQRRSNPLLFLGRHTEFIIRRCFLPYAFLFFALINLTNSAFISAAIGANLVWPIALYSYVSFGVVRRSRPASV